jgi:hypothetical protein
MKVFVRQLQLEKEEYGGNGAVTNVVTFGDEVVVGFIHTRCTSRKSRR